jgi:hypothetical protein
MCMLHACRWHFVRVQGVISAIHMCMCVHVLMPVPSRPFVYVWHLFRPSILHSAEGSSTSLYTYSEIMLRVLSMVEGIKTSLCTCSGCMLSCTQLNVLSCTHFHVLFCSLLSDLCSLLSALYSLLAALCPLLSALCSLLSAIELTLYSLPCAAACSALGRGDYDVGMENSELSLISSTPQRLEGKECCRQRRTEAHKR